MRRSSGVHSVTISLIGTSSSGRIGRNISVRPSLSWNCLLQLGRIGRDRVERRLRLGFRDHDPRVERDQPLRVGEQRIDVELDDVGQVHGDLREAQQHVDDLLRAARAGHGEAGKPLRDLGVGDHVLRQHGIERRQADAAVGDDLGRRAALAEQDDRAEGRVAGQAEDQLMRLRARHHRLHRELQVACIGPQRGDARQHLLGGRLRGRARTQAQRDAADIGFMGDVGRMDLRPRRGRRSLRRGGRPPPESPRCGSARSECRTGSADASLPARSGWCGPRSAPSRCSAFASSTMALGNGDAGRGRLEQERLVAPELGQMAEGAHGLLGAVEIRDAVLAKHRARGDGGVAAEPVRQDRDRAVGVDCRRDGLRRLLACRRARSGSSGPAPHRCRDRP